MSPDGLLVRRATDRDRGCCAGAGPGVVYVLADPAADADEPVHAACRVVTRSDGCVELQGLDAPAPAAARLVSALSDELRAAGFTRMHAIARDAAHARALEAIGLRPVGAGEPLLLALDL